MPHQGGDQGEATRRHLPLCRTSAVDLGLARQRRLLVASSWSSRRRTLGGTLDAPADDPGRRTIGGTLDSALGNPRRRTPGGTLDPRNSTRGDGGRRTLGVDERRTPGSSLPVVPAFGSPLPLVRAPGSPVLMDDNLAASVVRLQRRRGPAPSSSDVRLAFVVGLQRRQ